MANNVPIDVHIPDEQDAAIAEVLDPDSPAELWYKIERAERVDDRLDIHVIYNIPMPAGAWRQVSDTLHLYGNVTAGQIETGIADRIEILIRPRYLAPKLEIDPEIAGLVGTVKAV